MTRSRRRGTPEHGGDVREATEGGLHREVARFRVRSSLMRTIAVAEND
jgi:hypothetical protein